MTLLTLHLGIWLLDGRHVFAIQTGALLIAENVLAKALAIIFGAARFGAIASFSFLVYVAGGGLGELFIWEEKQRWISHFTVLTVFALFDAEAVEEVARVGVFADAEQIERGKFLEEVGSLAVGGDVPRLVEVGRFLDHFEFDEFLLGAAHTSLSLIFNLYLHFMTKQAQRRKSYIELLRLRDLQQQARRQRLQHNKATRQQITQAQSLMEALKVAESAEQKMQVQRGRSKRKDVRRKRSFVREQKKRARRERKSRGDEDD